MSSAKSNGDRSLSADGGLEWTLLREARADLIGAEYLEAAARAAFDALVCIRAGVRAAPLDQDVPVLDSVAGEIGRAAVAAHSLDLDDVHWPTATHPGSCIWPVALAVGADRGLSMGEVLDAAALGYQVVGRAAHLLGTVHRARFHVTATAGTLGAAVTAARLFGGDDQAELAALLTAGSVIGGSRQALREGADTAAFHRAHAALTGVTAAALGGSSTVRAPLSGSLGFAAATGSTLVEDSLSKAMSPVVAEMSIRSYGVNGFVHTMVEALLALGPVDADQIREVEVRLAAPLIEAGAQLPTTSRRGVAWSIPHVAAMAVTGNLGRSVFRWPLPSHVDDLAGRVSVIAEEASGSHDLSSSVSVLTIDQDWRHASRRVPKGHHTDPLSTGELVERAVSLGAVRNESAGQRLLDQLSLPSAEVPRVLV